MSRFKIDALERVIRTTVQSAAAAVLALWIQAGSFTALDWSTLWQVAVFAAGFTILTALAGMSTGSRDDASFLDPPR